MTPLGSFIEQWRTEHELSQADLARAMGLRGHSRISKVVSGANPPNLDFIERLANATGEAIGTLACLALGREVQMSGDREKMLRHFAKLSDEHAVLWDVMLLAVKNLEKPARLAAVVELLKE